MIKNKLWLLAVAMVALTVGSLASPPCAGGVVAGTVDQRKCLMQDSRCSLLLQQYTYDRTCSVWCCPDGSVLLGACTPAVQNGCCGRDRDWYRVGAMPACPQ